MLSRRASAREVLGKPGAAGRATRCKLEALGEAAGAREGRAGPGGSEPRAEALPLALDTVGNAVRRKDRARIGISVQTVRNRVQDSSGYQTSVPFTAICKINCGLGVGLIVDRTCAGLRSTVIKGRGRPGRVHLIAIPGR